MTSTTVNDAMVNHGVPSISIGINRVKTIPWIVAGPGIQAGELTTPIHIMDTAATAAYALGLPIPEEWDGVSVLEVFSLPGEKRLGEICSG